MSTLRHNAVWKDGSVSLCMSQSQNWMEKVRFRLRLFYSH
jgi:hypothetical protein